MSLLCDTQIAHLARTADMIDSENFKDHLVSYVDKHGVGYTTQFAKLQSEQDRERLELRKVVSYGLTSYGYDARLYPGDFQVFTNRLSAVIDPMNFDPDCVEEINEANYTMPPHSYLLGRTMETYKIPRNVTAICVGKSTYARAGVIVNVTPLESEWEGQVTLEICNSTPNPVLLRGGQGICQFLFLQGLQSPSVSYKDRAGKYMYQRGTQPPK